MSTEYANGDLKPHLMLNTSTFLLKLFDILERPDLKQIIEWSDNGRAFMIKDSDAFCTKILPQYFKHTNYASFIRQLNMYDFHKIRMKGTPFQIYQHPFFIKDKKSNLHYIQRKSNSRHPMRIQHSLQSLQTPSSMGFRFNFPHTIFTINRANQEA